MERPRIAIVTRLQVIADEDCPAFIYNAGIPTVFLELADTLDFEPVPVLWTKDLQRTCESCEGLIITGSRIDVDQSYFDPSFAYDETRFDEYKYNRQMIESFCARKKPVFGICSGLQELNIFFGGDVVQDMEGHYVTRHDVTFQPDTWFSDVYERVVNTNSYHHQCVGKPAPSLRIAATSADGVIEAMDYPGRHIIGFQWHPEVDQPELRDRVFEKFFKACAGQI